MNFKPDYIPLVLAAALAGYFLFQMASKGGFKGALFGGRVRRAHGEIELGKQSGGRGKIRIYTIESGEGSKIGIGISLKGALSFQMFPVTLEKGEARQFAQLLTQAVNES